MNYHPMCHAHSTAVSLVMYSSHCFRNRVPFSLQVGTGAVVPVLNANFNNSIQYKKYNTKFVKRHVAVASVSK